VNFKDLSKPLLNSKHPFETPVEFQKTVPKSLPNVKSPVETPLPGAPFQPHAVSLRLPPHGSLLTVVLTGRPLQAGDLTLTGCLMSCHGVTWSLLWESRGVPAAASSAGGGTAMKKLRMVT
jgi:hypothetical protein